MNLDRARGLPVALLVNFLENLDVTTNSAVLTEKLADYYEIQGKPSSAIEACQLALTRNPSPAQRIRIRLTLGDWLVAQSREAEAIENYKRLLTEAPDYPGRPMIEAKLNSLEQKFINTNNPVKP
jgi:tetratricopeptide (TPR) repeat protein